MVVVCTSSKQIDIVINDGQSFLFEDDSSHQYMIFNGVSRMVVRKRLCGVGLIEMDVYYLVEKQNRPKSPPSSLSLSLVVSGR